MLHYCIAACSQDKNPTDLDMIKLRKRAHLKSDDEEDDDEEDTETEGDALVQGSAAWRAERRRGKKRRRDSE